MERLRPLLVHMIEPPGEAQRADFDAALDPSIRLTVGEEVPADCRILVAGRVTPEMLARCPALEAVVIPWAGVPRKTRDVLLAHPRVRVHNLHHNAAATAEMAMALLLAAAKSIVPLDRALRAGDWRPRYQGLHSVELRGRTALILGLGAIGERVARACVALEMKVLATRRHAPAAGMAEGDVEQHPASALHALLPRAQVLIVCLPLTPETEGLIGAREMALLPADAILVNIGRGPIVDEEALHDALASRRLRAAGLDVWYRYPENEAAHADTLPARLPFHELDNVVLSPHRAGDNVETESRRMTALAGLLNAAARGEPLPNRVDLARGY
jgi:phosphoglycerate dehydrogenase-like enzyme